MTTETANHALATVKTLDQSVLQKQYPYFGGFKTPNLSQAKLREYVELIDHLLAAVDLYKEGCAISQQYFEPGRKKMTALVAKIYALYLQVEASPQKSDIYQEYRAVLKTKFKVTVHEDAPRSTLMMKMVLPKIDSKTALQYGRALDLAKGYEVDPSDYVAFIKGCGGYEKIRNAYAKVYAADAGKMLPLQKSAAVSATLAFISGVTPVAAMQLDSKQANQLARFQSAEGYCYLITRIDMHGYMEILSPIPPGAGWEEQLLKHIQKSAGTHPQGLAEYHRVYDLLLKKNLKKTVDKNQRTAELQQTRLKRAESQKKKDAAFQRKIAKPRAAAQSADDTTTTQ